jgi:adenylosuccinate synthase
MSATVVVGLQFGDEGKGKITDYLAARMDMVVRSQGGANAGHTVVVGDERFALHQVPSGILRPDVTCVIANGVVLDPEELLLELAGLERRGVDTRRLWVSDRAHLVMPYHKLLDGAAEDQRQAEARIGTTRRGIGPAYADKNDRLGLRVVDLAEPEALRRRVALIVEEKNRILGAYGQPPLDAAAVAEAYLSFAKDLLPRATDTSRLINGALDRGERVLFEGAQGTFLDVDAGTYPYVTSSHPTAGGVTVGAGVGPTRIDRVIGVIKAYTSRVGEGPFPAELEGQTADRIREAGREYGTTTGRPRRVGWLDLVQLRYAARVNGLSGVVVNALDALAELPELCVVDAYDLEGERVEDVPASAATLRRVRPVLRRVPAWPALGEVRKFADLPRETRAYLDLVEEAAGAPVLAISAGRDRQDVVEAPDRVMA